MLRKVLSHIHPQSHRVDHMHRSHVVPSFVVENLKCRIKDWLCSKGINRPDLLPKPYAGLNIGSASLLIALYLAIQLLEAAVLVERCGNLRLVTRLKLRRITISCNKSTKTSLLNLSWSYLGHSLEKNARNGRWETLFLYSWWEERINIEFGEISINDKLKLSIN